MDSCASVCHVLVFMCASLCVCVCLRMCLRAQVLVLRLRDSVVRLGEELEQSTQSEARERENARYFQQRLQDMRVEMEEKSGLVNGWLEVCECRRCSLSSIVAG